MLIEKKKKILIASLMVIAIFIVGVFMYPEKVNAPNRIEPELAESLISEIVSSKLTESSHTSTEASAAIEATSIEDEIESTTSASTSSKTEQVTTESSYEENISEEQDEVLTVGDSKYGTFLGYFTLTYYSKEDGEIGCRDNKLTVGYSIAVDRNVIPLGTTVYIEGLGERYAEDVGGAIKGNKIDVYVETNAEAIQLGVTRNVKVYI